MTESTNTLREALQQALDALIYHREQTRPIQRTDDAIEAARAALAAKPAEPTAFECDDGSSFVLTGHDGGASSRGLYGGVMCELHKADGSVEVMSYVRANTDPPVAPGPAEPTVDEDVARHGIAWRQDGKRIDPLDVFADPAFAYARRLAVDIHTKRWAHVTQWKPLDTTLGLLTQIDNMTSGLVQPTPAAVPAEPVGLPCGHPASLLLRSAETGLPLYCEACDDKSGRRDAETREAELQAEVARLRVHAEPVAEVMSGWSLAWVGREPLAAICARHPELRIGSKLYTAAPAPPQRQPLSEGAVLKLAAFGAAMLRAHRGTSPCEVGDIDGGAAQDHAIRCGVLEARTVIESCGESCVCAGEQFPLTCYFVPDDVRATRKAIAAAGGDASGAAP